MTNDLLQTEHEKEMQTKVAFFFNRKLPIHIVLRKGDQWENGHVVEEPSKNAFKLAYFEKIAKKKGKSHGYYFYMEIKDVEQYHEKPEAEPVVNPGRVHGSGD